MESITNKEDANDENKMEKSPVSRLSVRKIFERVGKMRLGLVMFEMSFLREMPRSMHLSEGQESRTYKNYVHQLNFLRITS